MIIIKVLLTLLPVTLGILFRRGKVLFLIAGNNTATRPYDKKSILAGKYVGVIMYGAALVVALAFFVPDIPNLFFWILMIAFIIFTLVISIWLNMRISKMSK